jgi:SAM-dependent methyltransferase
MSSLDLATSATRIALDLRQTRLPLSRAIGRLQPDWHSDWAWENYERSVVALAQEFGLARLLEIGGGRDPAFAGAARANGLTLIVNDIDPAELARLPAGFETACFDVSGDLGQRPEFVEAFDFVASRMVFEHIGDVEAAWRNVHRILRPGGVGLAFFPTLYAWPFVVNWLLPSGIAKRIVERFYPARAAEGENPVFPPVYDWCLGSEARMRRMLDPIGFAEAHVIPFWGHRYLERVPLAREIDNAFNRLAARLDWRLFTTYAYVVVRK